LFTMSLLLLLIKFGEQLFHNVSLKLSVTCLCFVQSLRDGLRTWMTEMDIFLHTEDPTKGDLPTLQAQLAENIGVQNDIQTLQKNMDQINHLYRAVTVNIEPKFGSKLSEEVEELNTNWNKVLILAEQQHDRLKGSLDSTEEVYRKIRKIITWLEPIKEEISNKDYSVESLNDLQVKTKKFRVSTDVKIVNMNKTNEMPSFSS